MKRKIFLYMAGVLFIAAAVAMFFDKKMVAYVTFLPAAACLVIGWKHFTQEKHDNEEDAP